MLLLLVPVAALAGKPAADAPPLDIRVVPPNEEHGNQLVVKNNGAAPTETICVSAPYEHEGTKYWFDWCEDLEIAPKKSITWDLCYSCSTVFPAFTTVQVDDVRFQGGSRWVRKGKAARTPDEAPMAFLPTGRQHWDAWEVGYTDLLEIVNIGTKPVASYSYRCDLPDGDYLPTAVMPGLPMEPGQAAFEGVKGTNCRFTSVQFADETEWETPDLDVGYDAAALLVDLQRLGDVMSVPVSPTCVTPVVNPGYGWTYSFGERTLTYACDSADPAIAIAESLFFAKDAASASAAYAKAKPSGATVDWLGWGDEHACVRTDTELTCAARKGTKVLTLKIRGAGVPADAETLVFLWDERFAAIDAFTP
jgi:hypothetical protein